MTHIARSPRRPVPATLILGLLVTSIAAGLVALHIVPNAHAATQVNNAPFEANFQEHIIAVDHQACPGLTGVPLCLTVEGIGTANYLGKATELLRGAVDFSNPDPNCIDLTTAPPGVTISADDGSGTLIIQHDTAEGCSLANSPAVSKLSFTWTITGGTGRFCGASGSGIETGTDNGPSQPREPSGLKEVHYTGTITLPGSC